MMKIQGIAIAVSAMLLACGAQASSFNNAGGLNGMVSSFTTESFDNSGAASNTLAGNLFAGLSFGANIYTSEAYGGSFANFSGTSITNFNPCCTAITSFSFASLASAAAFAFVTNNGISTFTAKLYGNAVESFSAATSTSNGTNYYGFSGIVFDSIEIQSGGSNNAYALDNLQVSQVSAVPEPTTYAMLLAGLGLLGFAARRKAAM